MNVSGADASDTDVEPPQSFKRRRSTRDIAAAAKRRLEKSLSLHQPPIDACSSDGAGHSAPAKRLRTNGAHSGAPRGRLHINAVPMIRPGPASCTGHQLHEFLDASPIKKCPVNTSTNSDACIFASRGNSSPVFDSQNRDQPIHCQPIGASSSEPLAPSNPVTLRHRPPE